MLAALALLVAAPAAAQVLTAASPDGSNRISLQLNGSGTPVYAVSRGGSLV
ncbi:hypothetical protein GY976_26155, partial [Escherichia coli]|nr:hypothetical protein [Escherichia coli]